MNLEMGDYLFTEYHPVAATLKASLVRIAAEESERRVSQRGDPGHPLLSSVKSLVVGFLRTVDQATSFLNVVSPRLYVRDPSEVAMVMSGSKESPGCGETFIDTGYGDVEEGRTLVPHESAKPQ